MKLSQIGFGDLILDVTTGIKGMVVCKAQWKNGCDKVIMQPKVQKPSEVKNPDTIWVDVQDVKILKTAKAEKRKLTGGPQRVPKN